MMRRKLLRLFLMLTAIQIIGFFVGKYFTKKLSIGDETSDEFSVASVMTGKQFHSTADHLRSGTAIASLGGLELDLRDATLDEDGATLELKAMLGGVQALVPATWRVDVDAQDEMGEVDVKVTAVEDLPDDAPTLHIDAITRFGGVVVTTKAS